MQVVAILFELHGGYTNYPCFIYLRNIRKYIEHFCIIYIIFILVLYKILYPFPSDVRHLYNML